MNYAGLILALLPAVFFAAPALAQNASEEDPSSRNGGQVTVYGWLAGATGEFTPFAGAPTLEFDNSFGEVLEDLDTAFFASAILRRDKFIAIADVSYASLSREGVLPPGIPASGKVSQLAITATAGARLVDDSGTTVDVLAGARLWDLGGRVEVPLVGFAVAPKKTFIDPIIAARINSQIGPRLSALVHGDIGGFGIGSDFTYQIVGTLNYQIGRSNYISVGWRHLQVDYTSGGTVFDGSQTGPIIGFTKRF